MLPRLFVLPIFLSALFLVLTVPLFALPMEGLHPTEEKRCSSEERSTAPMRRLSEEEERQGQAATSKNPDLAPRGTILTVRDNIGIDVTQLITRIKYPNQQLTTKIWIMSLLPLLTFQ